MNRIRISVALESSRGLAEVINVMTEDELLETLRIEVASQRRQTHLERMVTRLAALRAFRIKQELMEEYTPWRVNNPSS